MRGEDPWDIYAPEAGEDRAGMVTASVQATLTPDDARAMAADLLERAAYAELVAAELAKAWPRATDMRHCEMAGDHLGSALHSRSECVMEAGR